MERYPKAPPEMGRPCAVMVAIHRSETLGLERVTVTVRPHVTDMALREPDAGYQSSTHTLKCAAKAVRRAVSPS